LICGNSELDEEAKKFREGVLISKRGGSGVTSEQASTLSDQGKAPERGDPVISRVRQSSITERN